MGDISSSLIDTNHPFQEFQSTALLLHRLVGCNKGKRVSNSTKYLTKSAVLSHDSCNSRITYSNEIKYLIISGVRGASGLE
jgi:hypothetical protein